MIRTGLNALLKRRWPRAHRLLRSLRRPLRRWMGLPTRPGYWEGRKDFTYYGEVLRLAAKHAPSARQALDVGVRDTDVLAGLGGLTRRVVLDLMPVPRRRGFETVQMDFMAYQPDTYFDLVLCLQVLEHVKDPEAFAQKLLRTGRTVIISVPYRWPQGLVKGHVHDPVDEAKLERWTQRKPVETLLVADQKERLIAVYQN